MKIKVFCLCFCVCLLCGCAPRAREYSAIATALQTPYEIPVTSLGEVLDYVETQDPPVRFAVPAGWAVESDEGLYTLTCFGLDAVIEFTVTERIHPDYTYKKELYALEASAKRFFYGTEITYKNNYYVLGDYSGIELCYTYTPAGAGLKSAHTVIFFRDGYEYVFALTAGTEAFIKGEQALSGILFSLEI